MNVLVINAGSSSLKFQLIDMENEKSMAQGVCERIGLDGSIFKYKNEKGIDEKVEVELKNHEDAMEISIKYLTDKEKGIIESVDDIYAVGHRFSHGGEDIKSCVMVNEKTKSIIEKNSELAPLHNPANLTGIKACERIMKNVPMTAIPDTAFHYSIPKEAYMYALPYEFYEKYKIKKYGFHGMSHQYVSQKAAEIVGKPYDKLKIITCHLGSGSSITAVKYGKSVENSMGFTPLEGVPMGTRSGAIDPAILLYLINDKGYSAKELSKILHKDSGLLGISGISSDVRDLEEACEKGNERAKLALDVLSYRVKRCIGDYAAVLGGLDVLVFTAGIGENDIELREKVVEGLDFIGIEIDAEKNKDGKNLTDISKDGAKVKTLVIPTNEEIVIARETVKTVKKS